MDKKLILSRLLGLSDESLEVYGEILRENLKIDVLEDRTKALDELGRAFNEVAAVLDLDPIECIGRLWVND